MACGEVYTSEVWGKPASETEAREVILKCEKTSDRSRFSATMHLGNEITGRVAAGCRVSRAKLGIQKHVMLPCVKNKSSDLQMPVGGTM
jgi:hypothetical protein